VTAGCHARAAATQQCGAAGGDPLAAGSRVRHECRTRFTPHASCCAGVLSPPLPTFLPCRSGEDLTPYRAASKRISAILSRFGPTERLGLDEAWVDATAEAERRARDSGAPHWHGVVHSVQV
jgi:hypothetical protein